MASPVFPTSGDRPPAVPRLELLAVPAPAKPYLDLIAVHGILDHNPDNAWSALGTANPRNAAGAKTTNWLADADMLPSQVRNLRVSAFRYDTTPAREKNGGLRLHLERCAEALRERIKEHTPDKPLLFVAHGYGGLIVLKALLNAPLCERTIGVVCLGTAFRPVDAEIHNAIKDTLPVSNQDGYASGTNLASLFDEFEALPDLLVDFQSAKGALDRPIRCFYETEPVEDRGIIVPKQAAVLDWTNAVSFALEKVNHNTMNKFDGPHDHNYELISDVIQGLVDLAYPQMLVQAIQNSDDPLIISLIDAHRSSFPTNELLNEVLQATIVEGDVRTLQLLFDANIRVNAHLNEAKDTALILAVRSQIPNKAQIVRMLLEKGADIGAVNSDDRSAFDYAEGFENDGITNLLRDRPLILGPAVRKAQDDWIPAPHLKVNDYQSTRGLFAKIADVYDVNGEERTFLRNPSVHDLIYEHGPRHLMNRATSKESQQGNRKFRWLHLPANNLTWIKDLIQRTYRERDEENGRQRAYFIRKFQSITDKSHWEDMVIASPLPELTHIRHMTPRCRVLPYYGIPEDIPSADMILFMPYLHYEYTEKRESMAKAVNRIRNGARKWPARSEEHSADENSLWAYLKKDIPLHIRRTLDQFYYDSFDSDKSEMEDVPPRNQDQVVQRFMKSQKEWKGQDPLLLMVDQLWMVMLEDDTLITAFPERWGLVDPHQTNPIKDADIANMIAKELSNRHRSPLDTPFDMMLLIIELCTKVLFDSASHRNEKLRFFEFYERKIQEITNEESVAFTHMKNRFADLSERTNARVQAKMHRKLLDELLDISNELTMLNEIKDVSEELNMIDSLLQEQMVVMEKMADLLEYPVNPIPPTVNKKWKKTREAIELRRDRIADMTAHAQSVQDNIKTLFDMKQRQANALEAHISAKVAQDGERQSVTIMVFTVVTIIFLPLSFMSSFFALSVREWPRDPQNQNQVYMSLGYASLRIFGIGFGIAIGIVGLAFGINETRNRLTKPDPLGGLDSLPSSAASSAMDSAASFISSFQARATSILTPAGRPLILDPKRVLARRADGFSMIEYQEPTPCPPAKFPSQAVATGLSSSSSDSPATRSLLSNFLRRSTPKLASVEDDGGLAEKGGLARRQTKSWDVRRSKPRRWGFWRNGTM
ncbi:hypothetical protein BT63DRAFT_418056 [Microthyrium microscopicum]|uniref:Uncharacterized protein n=1 Tax=Microthyrium microscopicum TaxID=703497 RepID=A0A6A6TYC6_9PEZI|nr:hypothetical protein BT63DRAFT_418056 [Microthyrium microscopicum]